MIKLSEIKINTNYTIISNTSSGLLKERLLSLGFINNASIMKLKSGKKNSMDIYLIKGMMIALRKSEADYIWIK